MNEQTILFVVTYENEDQKQSYLNLLRDTYFKMPNKAFKIKFETVDKNKNLAVEYNKFIKKYNAKYSVYLNYPAAKIDYNMFSNIIAHFNKFPKSGIIGFLGSEMPINGDYRKAKKFFGSYYFMNDKKILSVILAKNTLFYKPVHMIDDSFFAVSRNIE